MLPKDVFGDLGEGSEQEVHGAVGGGVGESRAAGKRDALGCPARGRQLGARLEGALRDEREADALGELGVEAPAGRRLAQRGRDAETREERVERVGAAAVARIDDLDLLEAAGGVHGLGGPKHPRDRGHEAARRLAVDLVGAPDVVDRPRHGAAGLRVALVVGELQVADHRAVSVPAPCLTLAGTRLQDSEKSLLKSRSRVPTLFETPDLPKTL